MNDPFGSNVNFSVDNSAGTLLPAGPDGGSPSSLIPGSDPQRTPPASPVRIGIALCITVSLLVATGWLHQAPGRGASASYSLLIGVALGIIMQRGRFCFFCIFRDYIEEKDSRPFYSILSALAVGSICYTVMMSTFLPNPFVGRLPPDAHIGPVSWVLVMAGVAFGVGMAISGACVSGQLYRLGEGYGRAPFALIGTVIGFALGFFTWRPLYENTISVAPIAWLPEFLGYGGSLALQLVVLGLLALVLMRKLRPTEPLVPQNISLSVVWENVFVRRWKPGPTGAMVGVLGGLAYLRVAPLGVTSQIGSVSRTLLSDAGMLTGRLNGLDTFSGCVTLVIHTISNNGLLITGVVGASLAAALIGNHFELSRVSVKNSVTALIGGVLMGWGSMLALGCTVGTLLSGIMAFSLSGWIFFAAVFVSVWVSIRLRLHKIAA